MPSPNNPVYREPVGSIRDLPAVADEAVWKDAVERLRRLLPERRHVIQFSDDGWIIAHPVCERLYGDLFSCHLNWDDDDPGVRGRFWLLDDGTLDGPSDDDC